MGRRERLFNVLTFVMLGLTVLTLAYYIFILLNPTTPLNPFPPARRVALLIFPTATPTPIGPVAPPTWTPTTTPTVTPTPPSTFTPTATPLPSPTSPPFTPRPTRTPTPRVTRSPYSFSYQLDYQTPYYGCNWAGVAGLVQDLDGKPLTGYSVHIWGGGLDIVSPSGDYPLYGDSGWEGFFNNYPIRESGEFKVQLHDKNPPHTPLSEVVILNYQGLCSKSLAFVVFTKNH